MRRILSVVCMLSVVSLGGACASQSEELDADSQAQAQWSTGSAARKASAEPFGCKGDRIALETYNGRNYLTAVVGGGFAMLANASSVGKNETFRAYDLGNDRVALQVANGSFVVAENGGGLLLNANARAINNNTTFRLSWTADGEWLTLRSAAGHYVTAEGGGGGVANAAWILRGANQGFKAICLQGDLDGTEESDGDSKPGSAPEWGRSDEPDSSDSSEPGWGPSESSDDSDRPGPSGPSWGSDDSWGGSPGLGD